MNHQIVIQYKNISFLIVSVYEPSEFVGTNRYEIGCSNLPIS